ncbi:hypothetical protein CAPTEDRAFT_217937 [Capitella teleta]|uniref:RING-type domain-containing protein n=1 Tax=Capitella teleta TaxID=283909 RepID=R7UC55_CAPTE|nr:hypothetical protein CAPTEDRAFT_217937 [Capitella teleta]|eukprot:ELU03701.1 hypothetical protein CAPTEDRAFT_217937 [Capitella teleta]
MDIREMTFQNVLDTVLKPAGVKVGGFPEELFLDLSESDKESLTWLSIEGGLNAKVKISPISCLLDTFSSVSFLIVNDCRQCDNKHLFCHTCVFAWSMTFGENSQKCPMCRCPQTEYLTNKEVNRILDDKRVQCYEDTCRFRSPLKIFLMHSHGKAKFSNVHVDFSRLHPPRSQARNPGSRVERAVGIRTQLQQGRVMIHQMMTLLHLEMQLRQQALNSYQEAQDPMRRIQRLDEVLALNEQLNEVGGILSGLLTTPLSRLSNNDESDLNGTLSDMGASLRRGLINRPSVIQGLNDPALLQRAGESMRDGLRRLRTPDNEADNTPRRTPETDTGERRFENTPFITERSNRFSRQTESPSESSTPPSTPREHVLISRAREPSRQILRSQEPTTPRMPQPTQSGESSLGVHVALPPIASPQSETPTIEETSDEPRIIPEDEDLPILWIEQPAEKMPSLRQEMQQVPSCEPFCKGVRTEDSIQPCKELKH